jgi:hypothetical protein
MRIIGSAAIAALLLVGSTAWVTAQTQTQPAQKANPTKVYSYTQTLPKQKSNTAPMAQQPGGPEHLPNSVPYGSPRWWEETLRGTGGE